MAFIPTEKQIDSLYLLLKQLAREKIEVRVIRFIKWAEDPLNWEMEVVCFEDIDRYKIYFNGKIIQESTYRGWHC